jgi:hypothetical protein
MSKTITMMRMIVPIPMYMAVSPCSSQGQGRRFATCQQALALPAVGSSKPAGHPACNDPHRIEEGDGVVKLDHSP